MNRIDRIFKELRASGRKALMPFLTAGDPDLATTGALLGAIDAAGASVCELGIPFSDPIADGPVIQASMHYALQKQLRTGQILEMVAQQRAQLNVGLVAMVSYSIVHRLGTSSFMKDAATAGFDGMIVPDLPVEASDALCDAAGAAGLTCSFLIAPTTPLERAQQLAKASSGFVYMLARGGLTGERAELPQQLPQRVQQMRDVTDLPITVGFGISTPQQVRTVVSVADAAIVGSAIMRRVADNRDQDSQQVVATVRAFVEELAGGLTQEAAAG